jgi:hypothetical protein
MTVAESDVWYALGLRFECQRCSDCCRGEPGYVWVDETEIRQMAAELGLLPEEFIQSYVRRAHRRLSLKELPGGDCILWGGLDRGCLVYGVRPVQCKTFPFWAEYLRTPEDWRRVAERCPGVGRGRLYTLAEITKLLRR